MMKEEKEVKTVILYVECECLVDQSVDEELLYISREEVAKSIKKVYFINDDNEEVDITRRLRNLELEELMYLRNQTTQA